MSSGATVRRWLVAELKTTRTLTALVSGSAPAGRLLRTVTGKVPERPVVLTFGVTLSETSLVKTS